jgi:hypothetical protein
MLDLHPLDERVGRRCFLSDRLGALVFNIANVLTRGADFAVSAALTGPALTLGPSPNGRGETWVFPGKGEFVFFFVGVLEYGFFVFFVDGVVLGTAITGPALTPGPSPKGRGEEEVHISAGEFH